MTSRIPLGAFEFYFANRSYRTVAEKYGVSKRAVTAHAKKENWQSRVAEREAKVRQASEKKAIETLEGMNDRHLKSLRFIQGKAIEALRSMALDTAMEAVRAIDISIKQERVIRGEPADRTAVSVEDAIRTEYQRWLVSDEAE